MAQLPAELWIHIFGHLSVTDKFSVRASCRHFKRLVDEASLWRNWAVVLTFKNGPYHRQFWDSLRRRKVSNAVIRTDLSKHWKQMSLYLPDLSSLVLEPRSVISMRCLPDFPQLRRVAVRCRGRAVRWEEARWPEQLTHLSLCGVTIPTLSDDFRRLSQLKALTSFTCHFQPANEDPLFMIRTILYCLPQLKHLSVSMIPRVYYVPRADGATPPMGGEASRPANLSSLELIGCCSSSLPEDVMRLMPGLSRLALFYERYRLDSSVRWSPEWPRLQPWLQELPHLSELVLVRGPPIFTYTPYIPATVTSLTLCVAGLTPKDLAQVALDAPDLLHLHIDPWPSHLGAMTADIPRLFPKLRSLKLRHEHVPEEDFLLLHQLQDLEHLEVLDDHPRLSELIGKLQALTKDRVNITTTRCPRDVLSCPCVEQLY